MDGKVIEIDTYVVKKYFALKSSRNILNFSMLTELLKVLTKSMPYSFETAATIAIV